jgi:hypothetical protein
MDSADGGGYDIQYPSTNGFSLLIHD